MKKLLLSLVLVASGLSAFAQDSSPSFDLTGLDTTATAMANGVKALFTGTILPNALIVLSGVAIVWGLFILWRWIRKGAGR